MTENTQNLYGAQGQETHSGLLNTNTQTISVDREAIARLSQNTESGGIFTGDAFYRYPEEFDHLEEHMREHIQAGRGDYLLLDVGASTGKEPISAVISWHEMVQAVNPQYQGRLGILALERNPEAIAAFRANKFPIYSNRDYRVDTIIRYASATEKPTDNNSGPSFTRPQLFVSFTEELLAAITYIQMDAESSEVVQLPQVFRANGFDAVISHTTSRYFNNEGLSMQRIKDTLNPDGYLSHVR